MHTPSEESLLHDGITRDLEVCENKDGYWYYTIKQSGKQVCESNLYQTSTECCFAGMKMMDELHDQSPLLHDGREMK